MSKLEFTSTTLPSRGVFYNDKLPEGTIQVRKMTVNEDELLQTSGGRVTERLDKIIGICTRIPNNALPVADLLLTDRLFILLTLRCITHGPHYTFTYQCPYCRSMNREDVNIAQDLDEVTPEVVERNMLKAGREGYAPEEPFTLHLPDEGVDVGLRFLRGTDEAMAAGRAKRVAVQSANRNDPSSRFLMALQIVSIDGNDELPVLRREDFVQGLTSADAQRIRNEVEARETGVNLKVYPTCNNPQCNATNEMMMPFDSEFFRPTNL